MTVLALAALVWIGIHLGIAGSALRRQLVASLGENAFRGLFSVATAASIAFLIFAYRHAPTMPLWTLPAWAYYLLAALMLPAFILLVGSLAGPNPTAVGQTLGTAEPRGMTRVTRHPMLNSFAIWALVHIAASGEVAATLFFGAFALTAIAGMPSIDAKLAARDPATWTRLRELTSIVPFGAIATGRNRFVAGEIPWFVWLLGVVLWALMLQFHGQLIGVPGLPV